MWTFSGWLNRHKFKLNRAELDEIVPGDSLSEEIIISLWDNLYYDILFEINPNIRQACLLLLIADNFQKLYKNYSPGKSPEKDEQEREVLLLERLANGKVLVDRRILSAEEKKSEVAPGQILLPFRTSKKQEARHRAKLAELDVTDYKSMIKELKKFKVAYDQDYEMAFEDARERYEKLVEMEMNEYFEKYPESRKIPEIEYELPESIIDDFKFDFPDPLSPEYLRKKLSEETFSYIEENCFANASVEDVIRAIEEETKAAKKVSSSGKQKKIKSISLNGVILRSESTSSYEYGLSFKKPRTGCGRGNTAYLSLNTGYNNAFIKNGKFEIRIDEKSFQDHSPEILSTRDETLLVSLFSDELELPKGKNFEFNAEFELNNGDQFLIKTGGNTAMSMITGYAIPILTITGSEVEHYGIQRIGIADYRRVEQELCCYIPGEVSHIENILAREYKERSTRKFTSTVSTTETVSEREVEESTDTVSTTRHEMSSEIAEVINRDRQMNLGFNASLRGEYPGTKNEFALGTSGSFGIGQSTSESNATARRYAEDMTNRALERIVTRTTQRRTSTIIREFEDMNKHGYDNREGDRHVTGVFRWIDALYKNRIVNYRKRLMYEFLIPEPARFYRDLMFSKAEDTEVVQTMSSGDTGSNLPAEPVHPSEHGIKDASSITRDNYSNLTSIYGVNAVAPMDQYANVSQSSSESIGNTDKSKSFNYHDLLVPDNYKCYEISGTVSLGYKARVNPKAYMTVNTAGKSKKFGEYKGSGSKTGSISHSLNNIEGQITISVNTKKITNFSLTIEAKCRLKSHLYEQWQQDIYSDIMDAYNTQLQAYNDAVALEQANSEIENSSVEEESPKGINPKFGKEIILTELKRLCIEMLIAPFNIPQGGNFYEDGDCEAPKLKLGKAWDLYASRVKFFEQAFDWHILSHIFYPYYWANCKKWPELMQTEAGNDHIFRAFLTSGAGRLIVPVREGFEDAVTFFMATGKIWMGTGMVLDTDDELYLSIVDELTHVEGVVEGQEWDTIVPTSLNIVQAKSALLEEEGLPCCESDADFLAELTLKGDENILELMKPEE